MSPEGQLVESGIGVPVVGVGASAGGLEAFQHFLSAVPPDGGVAYVLIQHIDPNYKSHLPELLAKWTEMPVAHVANGELLRPDHVYLAPPNALLRLEGGRIYLDEFEEPRGLRRPIDSFFESLAAAQHENCACIVLSGTGSDGAAGLRAVREAGGLTLVQDPQTAKYDGMPQSAVSTRLADHVVPIDRMPRLLLGYFEHWQRDRPDARENLADYVAAVCGVLRDRLGHDFGDYKRNTLIRRIARRVQVCGAESHEAYVEMLRTDMGECERLFRDLLINVTAFFRDREAFEALAEKAIRPIVAAKTASDNIRVWVPGCSSGEEAYSIAILLRDAMRRAGLNCHAQIFATDIDDRMLKVARTGIYPEAIASQVPPRLLAEYFVPLESGYAVASHVQDMVYFSPHNMLKDPPFSRLDLISCRNTLIYMQSRLQERLYPIFAYGLLPGGFLFLGSSEGLSLQRDVFDTVDLPARLYAKRRDAKALPTPLQLSLEGPRRRPARPAAREEREEEGHGPAAAARVLERYAPPHLVVDRRGRIEYASGRLGKYLDFSPGAPSSRLTDVARPSVKPHLRLMLESARSAGRRQVRRGITVRSEIGEQEVDLVVEPMGKDSVLVLFQDVAAFRAATDEDAEEAGSGPLDTGMVEALEDELERTREQLRGTVEELETSNEELKSSNEEMMSMNEELQSTNEELTTVNDELRVKVDELAAANGDLQNLLQATDLATIFVDKELSLRTFTPAAAEIYHLKPHDRGRSLLDLAPRIDGVDLGAELRRVLRKLETVEREVVLKGGERSFILRISPYRTVADVIDGLVITLIEITQLKEVQDRLVASHGRYAAAARASGQVLYDWHPDTGALEFAGPIEQLTGYMPEEMAGGFERLLELVSESEREQVRAVMLGAAEKREPFRIDFALVRKDGSSAMVETRGDFFEPGGGQPVRVVGFLIDNSHRIELEQSRRHLIGELQHRVKNVLATVQSLVRQTAKNQPDKASFESALSARLAALARTHEVISHDGWTRTSLPSIVEREIRPYAGAREDAVMTLGPEVLLPPRQALAITLALHELATNAAKHGALSDENGCLRISWAAHPDRDGTTVVLDWREADGPPVQEPKKRGFGRTLLERGLAHDLNGEVRLDFAPDGLRARILFRFREDG